MLSLSFWFFLSEPISLQLPTEDLQDYIDSDGTAFSQVPEDTLQRIESDFGTVERFFRHRLLNTEAGVYAYNHNVDTSEAFYGEIITTRTYQERLDTLDHVRNAGINVCCGGIVGMGEKRSDRAGMLKTLVNMPKHPESVPINLLVKVEGTPLDNVKDFDGIEFVRTIAVARVLMPYSHVRLSAGREDMSDELQALCFFAGANSIFMGEQLLTTPNPDASEDFALFEKLGIRPEGQRAADAGTLQN